MGGLSGLVELSQWSYVHTARQDYRNSPRTFRAQGLVEEELR